MYIYTYRVNPARVDAVAAALWLDLSRSKCLYISIDRFVRVNPNPNPQVRLNPKT